MLRGSEFAKEIDKIAAYLNGELPAAEKAGIPAHLEALIKR
jgi:anti-sigma factor RsiW